MESKNETIVISFTRGAPDSLSKTRSAMSRQYRIVCFPGADCSPVDQATLKLGHRCASATHDRYM